MALDYDFRILIETISGSTYSYGTGSFVHIPDNADKVVLPTSGAFDIIKEMPVIHYYNGLASRTSSAGADELYTKRHLTRHFTNTDISPSDYQYVSASHNGSESGSITFFANATPSDANDYVKRYKFFGNKVCSVLGVPENYWIYSDAFRLTNTGSEANYISGDVLATSVNVKTNFAISNAGAITTDLPFHHSEETDRWIKWVNVSGSGGGTMPSNDMQIGYSKLDDRYEIQMRQRDDGASLLISGSISSSKHAGFGLSQGSEFTIGNPSASLANTAYGHWLRFQTRRVNSSGFFNTLEAVTDNFVLYSGSKSDANLWFKHSTLLGKNANIFKDSSITFDEPDALLELWRADTTAAATTNKRDDHHLHIQNQTDTADAYAGISFDVGNPTDDDSIMGAIKIIKDQAGDTHSGHMSFWTNNDSGDGGDDDCTERMRITNSGSVGIGTSSPLSLLQVTNTTPYTLGEDDYSTDSIALYGSKTNNDGAYFGGITWHNNSRRRAGISSVMESTDADYVGIAFHTQGTDGSGDFTESMRITHDGDLRLHGDITSSGDINLKSDKKIYFAREEDLNTYIGENANNLHLSADNRIDFKVDGSTKATMTATGLWGFGQSHHLVPEVLTVNGNISASGALKLDLQSGLANFSIDYDSDQYKWVSFRPDAFRNDGTNGFVFKNDGDTSILSVSSSTTPRVGIGILQASYPLDVRGNESSPYVGSFRNTTSTDSGNSRILQLWHSQEDSSADYDTSEIWIDFNDNSGTTLGTINNEVTYNTFTGAHISQRPSGSSYTDWKPGLIVKSTGNLVNTGSKFNGISMAWPEVELTTTQKDKAVIGVFSNTTEGTDGTTIGHNYNGLDNNLPALQYNALGEGKILVTDTNGNIETGDYICSSTRTGHGEKQDDDILHNYTVAKATQPIDFSTIEVDSNLGYKSVLVACTYHCG